MSERLDDTTPQEEIADPITPEQEEARRRRSRTRAITVMILAVVLVAAGAALVIANIGEPNDPTRVPEAWEEPDLDNAETLDLGDGRYSAVVVVSAGEETCWNGYIVDQELDECGPKTYKVEGAKATIGLNAKTEEESKFFLGLAVWDGNVTRLIESESTRKKFGVVAITASVGLQ